MAPRFPHLAAIGLTLCLGACAGTAGKYPSLAIRDAERVTGSAEPVESGPPAPLPPPGADLEERIASLVAQAESAHGVFQSRYEPAFRTVSAAKGASIGGEEWTQAQVALSSLDTARSTAVVALADLDRLYADERIAHPGEPSPVAEALGAARGRIESLVNEENAAITKIGGVLD